jgi:PAS domain S-box-containing protein
MNRPTEMILESITDAFVAVDREWRFTYLNEQALVVLHRAREELLGKNMWEEFPDAVELPAYREYHRAMASGSTVRFEEFNPSLGVWVQIHAYPSEDGLSIYFRDITERKRAEKEVETRAHQQAIIAELGLRALADDDLQAVMDAAVALVAQTLQVQYTKIVERLPGGEELLMRAGVGWKEGVVGNATEEAGLDSQAGYTLHSEEPVVMEDLSAEKRFRPSALLQEHGVVSGMSVVIHGRDGPFGVLGAHTQSRRSFSDDDVIFLQAAANVLAMRVEREGADKKLREVREAERSRIARDLHDEALQDLTDALVEARLFREESAERPESAGRLGRLIAALERVTPRLRSAIYDLSLEGDQEKPFSELLESLVGLHREMAPEGLDIRLDLRDGVLEGPLGETGRELLRIIGEALTNARRHSEASNVLVSVSTSEDGKRLWAEVSDDGRGFEPAEEPSAAATTRGMGTRGMRKRARLLGGDLKIESEPGQGTKVSFAMPLDEKREDEPQ